MLKISVEPFDDTKCIAIRIRREDKNSFPTSAIVLALRIFEENADKISLLSKEGSDAIANFRSALFYAVELEDFENVMKNPSEMPEDDFASLITCTVHMLACLNTIVEGKRGICAKQDSCHCSNN